MFSQPHTGEASRYERAAFETLPRAGLRFQPLVAPLGGRATSTLAALEAAVLVLVASLAMTALIVSAA